MKQAQDKAPPGLTDEDKERIRAAFHQEVVPKLARLNARLGTLCCEFAGEEYVHWTLRFRSAGSDFEIVDFEYDEAAAGIDLDL